MSLIRLQRLSLPKSNKLTQILTNSNINYSTQKKSDKPIFKFNTSNNNDPNSDLLNWVTQSNSSPSAPLLPWYSIQLNIREKLAQKDYYGLFLYIDHLINSKDISKNTLKLTLNHEGLKEMNDHLVYPYIKHEIFKFGKKLVELGHFPINWKLSTITLRNLIDQKQEELIWKLFELSRIEINLNNLEFNEEFYNFLLGYYSYKPSEKYFELIEFLNYKKMETKWYYKSLWQAYSKSYDLMQEDSNNFETLKVNISEGDVEELLGNTINYFNQNSNQIDNAPDGSMLVYIIQTFLKFNTNNQCAEGIVKIIDNYLDLPESLNLSLVSIFNRNNSSLNNIEGFDNFLKITKSTEQQKLAILKPILNHIYINNIEKDIPYLDFIDYIKGKDWSYPIYCLLTKILIKLGKSKEFHIMVKSMKRQHFSELDRSQLMTIIKGYDTFSNYYQIEYYYKLMETKFGQSDIPHNIALIYMNCFRRTFNLDRLIDYYKNTYLKHYSRDLQSIQILGFTCMKMGDLNKLDELLIDPLLNEANPSLTLLTPLLQYRFYLCINNQLLKDSIETLEKMFNLGVLPNFKIIQLIKINLTSVSIFKSKMIEWDKLYGNNLIFRGFKNSLK